MRRHFKTLAPGSRIRVLVVDDSATIRSIVTRTLGEDPAIEVVGTAANGAIALSKMAQFNPHVITLDIEMPEMNGLEMLKALRPKFPEVAVLMLSTLTVAGATATFDALLLGANEYVTKPTNCGSLEQCIAELRAELAPKIKQFFVSPERTIVKPACIPNARAVSAALGPPPRREVVALGISTGGPNALSAIFPKLPVPFPCPMLIVQHMPPLFTRLLADRLQSLTSLVVEEAAHGSPIESGKILIAPGGAHMRVKQSAMGPTIALDLGPPRNSCRPSVDVLFESVNEVYGGGAVAAVLTGMGQDGLHGAELLKASGAHVVVQDEASSVVWGMPGLVAKAGLADAVLPLDALVPHIVAQFDPRRSGLAAGT